MHAFVSEPAVSRSPLRSAIALTVCIFVTALMLLPVAVKHSGTGGSVGLAAAAAICLFSATVSEFLGSYLHHQGSALAALGVSMASRTIPPLAVCLVLAARGNHGREHLPFICYLFAFYLVTLISETWFAVKRVANQPTKSDAESR